MFGKASLVKVSVGIGSDNDDAGSSVDEILMYYS